jgi:hypothetical protein
VAAGAIIKGPDFHKPGPFLFCGGGVVPPRIPVFKLLLAEPASVLDVLVDDVFQ